jgi:hypothetical protein
VKRGKEVKAEGRGEGLLFGEGSRRKAGNWNPPFTRYSSQHFFSQLDSPSFTLLLLSLLTLKGKCWRRASDEM